MEEREIILPLRNIEKLILLYGIKIRCRDVFSLEKGKADESADNENGGIKCVFDIMFVILI